MFWILLIAFHRALECAASDLNVDLMIAERQA